MVTKSYTISEVAKLLGVEGKNSSTVRLWSETFADWLSPSARPEKGQLRLYTEDDLKVLMVVRSLRQQHMPYDEIRGHLAAGEAEEGSDDGQTAESGSGSVGEAPATASVDDFREILAPILEVAGPLTRLVGEQEQANFRIQVEIARLHSSLDVLSGRLEGLQTEIRALRMAQNAAIPPASAGVATVGSAGTAPRKNATSSASVVQPVAIAQPVTAVAAELPAPSAPTNTPAVAEAVEQVYASPSTTPLNRYGLRPMPARLDVPSLGALFLCNSCGSTTRPMGVTPTSRVVLSCIGCDKRMAIPTSRVEKALGVSRGFWARLWRRFVGPFARNA